MSQAPRQASCAYLGAAAGDAGLHGSFWKSAMGPARSPPFWTVLHPQRGLFKVEVEKQVIQSESQLSSNPGKSHLGHVTSPPRPQSLYL